MPAGDSSVPPSVRAVRTRLAVHRTQARIASEMSSDACMCGLATIDGWMHAYMHARPTHMRVCVRLQAACDDAYQEGLRDQSSSRLTLCTRSA